MIQKQYFPNRDIKLGIKIWNEMVAELLQCRDLFWRLFIRDFSVKYRQSFLGYTWALIMPFITIGVFVYLQRNGIFNIGRTDVPYPLFALIGLTVWQIFAVGINSGVSSLVAAGGMITKINFPRESLVISSLAQSLFEFLIKSVLIVVVCFYYKFIPSWGSFLVPFALLPLIAFTLGLSLILSMFNAIFRDTANAVVLFTTFLLFLTPVLYPVSGKSALLFKLNPLTVLVNAPRDLIIYGYIKAPADYLIICVFSFLFLLFAWRIFHIVETKIPERL